MLRDDLLVVEFAQPQRTLSWAIVGGGRRLARAVVWMHVDSLPPDVNPRALLAARLDTAGFAGAVGLMTSGNLSRFEEETLEDGALNARCVATVGLSNALAAGDPPGRLEPGTINLLCRVSCKLSEEALIEACALAAEARTAALLEARVKSTRSDALATGTGTDCIVIASPDDGDETAYAGKHTAIGALIGRSVREAVGRGVQRWLARR